MNALWVIVIAGYAICVALAIFSLTARQQVPAKVALAPLLIAFIAHTVWLQLRALQQGRSPLVGTEEVCAFLAWILVIASLIASRWFHVAALKAFIYPIVLILTMIAAITPGTDGKPSGLDSPLQRWLFPFHAGFILIAYCAFFIAFGAGLMYIIQERELKLKRFGTIFFKLPSLDTCDAIGSKAMAIGFALFTFGMAAGIGWQRARDGQYWHGDPFEVFSVITWLIYLFLIQSRINTRWGGRAAALASILSFMIVIVSLVGVRYLGSLHVSG